MTTTTTTIVQPTPDTWLKRYYYLRAAFSIAWVIAAFATGQHIPAAAAVLLVLYPAWDAFSNLLDASRSGGLGRNRSQAINLVVSAITTVAVFIALPDMHHVLAVFGAWAILSGLLQLGTALKRWKGHGGQATMILSGAQSALAGGFFISQALAPAAPSIMNVAGYAGVGAFYFLVSALWLTASAMRTRRA
jgi:hypothetical protein